ncbi:tail fiber domain-containing protein [Phocaeicola plebeius]|uniref:tail fiber domain-containing protein n=1 Tax=Phocaeicola plebeius TaxID=310297 RepID=UPI0026EEDA19|nr:tail fiber domain-containing protein [Phocaeicola plebeius]
MINSSLKEKYWDSATDKQMVISVVGTNQKIENSMLEIGTFALEESLCSESELKFGACEANCVKFTARNTAGNIIGKTISIEETIDGDSQNPMPYGVFKVASDVPTADRTKRQITAYDAMYDIINTDVKSWYAGLSFPITLKQFRDSFFAYLGIAQVETSLVNDSMTVNKTIVATQTDDSSAVTEETAISGKTVVTAICEINGCFGNINREGKFEYVFLKAITSALYPAEDLYPREDLFPSDANTESMTGHYITFDYEDFQSKAITQLEIKTSEDNAGAIVGTAGNNYSITGNFLVSDKTGAELEQIANNLLPIMKQPVYTPIKSCTCVGNPCLTLGEPIRFNTTREIVETYLLQRTLTGVQSKRDSISAQGTQTHSAKVNSIRDTIESVERRTGKLERNADHLQSTYEDLEEQTNTKFEQTTKSIVAEVNRAQKAEGQLDASLELKLGRDENDQIISMINASADQIMLRGNRLIVESNNFRLDGAGRVTIIDSLNFNSTALGDDLTIIGLDGRGKPLLQNILVDTNSVTDQDGVAIGDHASTADHATTADSATTAGSATQCIKASTAYYLQGITSNEHVQISGHGNLIPSSSSVYCGTTENPFAGGYSSGGWKTTSDRRKKKDFRKLLEDDRFERFFELLQPMEYRLIENDDKMHIGFVAQDVEQAMKCCDISENEFYGLEHAEFSEKDFESNEEWEKFLEQNGGANDMYTLCYQEFIALNTAMIQKLQNRCNDFERRLSALERK